MIDGILLQVETVGEMVKGVGEQAGQHGAVVWMAFFIMVVALVLIAGMAYLFIVPANRRADTESEHRITALDKVADAVERCARNDESLAGMMRELADIGRSTSALVDQLHQQHQSHDSPFATTRIVLLLVKAGKAQVLMADKVKRKFPDLWNDELGRVFDDLRLTYQIAEEQLKTTGI